LSLDDLRRQAAGRPDRPRPWADRTGQTWASQGVPFLVVGRPSPADPPLDRRVRLHPIVWLLTEGSVDAMERDTMPEFSDNRWEDSLNMERL